MSTCRIVGNSIVCDFSRPEIVINVPEGWTPPTTVEEAFKFEVVYEDEIENE